MDTLLSTSIRSRDPMTLEPSDSASIQSIIGEALVKWDTITREAYDSVGVFSLHLTSGNTGGKKDSEEFVQLMCSLGICRNAEAITSLDDNSTSMPALAQALPLLDSLSGARRLFVFHYDGHGITKEEALGLFLTPILLFLMDSCHAAVGSRGKLLHKSRVEFVAATAQKGISKSRLDGVTFTQHWCRAFQNLYQFGKPFTCDHVLQKMPKDNDLEQDPNLQTLRPGLDLPSNSTPASISGLLYLTL